MRYIAVGLAAMAVWVVAVAALPFSGALLVVGLLSPFWLMLPGIVAVSGSPRPKFVVGTSEELV
jgi:hypothetical protein